MKIETAQEIVEEMASHNHEGSVIHMGFGAPERQTPGVLFANQGDFILALARVVKSIGEDMADHTASDECESILSDLTGKRLSFHSMGRQTFAY